jgi:hypothetical protein
MGQEKGYICAYRRCKEDGIDKIKEEFDKPNKQILTIPSGRMTDTKNGKLWAH